MLYLLTGKRGYRIGITNIYKVFNKSRLYRSGQGFRRLNEELLNQEISKLGAVQQTLARLCHPIYASEDNRFTVDFLLTQDDRKKGITLKELEYLIDKIKSIEGNTLREIFISVEEQSNLEKSNSKVTTKRFNRLLNRLLLGEMKNKRFIIYELGKLYSLEGIDDEQSDNIRKEAEQRLKELCDVSKEELLNWYKYIVLPNDSLVRYYTYHATKGLEYDNVVIIMENKFGKCSNYFNVFSRTLIVMFNYHQKKKKYLKKRIIFYM